MRSTMELCQPAGSLLHWGDGSLAKVVILLHYYIFYYTIMWLCWHCAAYGCLHPCFLLMEEIGRGKRDLDLAGKKKSVYKNISE